MDWALWIMIITSISAGWTIFAGLLNFLAGEYLYILDIIWGIYAIITVINLKKENKTGYYMIISLFYVNLFLNLLAFDITGIIVSLAFAVINTIYFKKRKYLYCGPEGTLDAKKVCESCGKEISDLYWMECKECGTEYHIDCANASKKCVCESRKFKKVKR